MREKRSYHKLYPTSLQQYLSPEQREERKREHKHRMTCLKNRKKRK